MNNYTPADSLAYLSKSVTYDLDALTEFIHDVNGTGMEEHDLPEHLQDAVALIQNIKQTLHNEAHVQGVATATHYSNGIPIITHYKGSPIHDGGVTYRPDTFTVVHPSGTPDTPIPPQLDAV